MKFTLLLLCLCGLLSFTCAAMAYYKTDNSRHPGKCVFANNIILSPGTQQKDPNGCVNYTCDNANGFGSYASCGVVAVPPNCRLGRPANVNKYPDCCDRPIVC